MRRPSRRPGWWTVLFAMGVLLGSGCVDKDKQDEQPKATKAEPETPPPPPKPALKASEDDCVGRLMRSAKPRTISFADRKFRLDGYLLTALDKDPDNQIVLGVLSDTKENTEDNRKNLARIMEFFKKEKVEAIIHLGDVASTVPMPEEIEIPETDEKGNPLTDIQKERQRRRMINKARRESMAQSLEDIVQMVSILADSDLPVLVIIGNRECKTTFNSAMATLSEDYPNVFNLNFIRRIDLDDVDILSMPGYHDPEYVHCAWDKCLYYESDTLSLIDLAKEATDPAMVVSHGPPRQRDRNGIDVVSEGANVGNPALADAIRKAGIPLGAFGNIQEAGGKATDLTGSNIIAQDTFVNALYLNPGPADSMTWSMNDGTESRGMAAVVRVVGDKAAYKIYRVDQENAAEAKSSGQEKPQTPDSQPQEEDQEP